MTLDRAIVALVALASLAGAGLGLYSRATLADTNQRLALLERQDQIALESLKLEQGYRRAILAKLDALCRAVPKANCPLGENER